MHARARHESTTNRPTHRRRRVILAAATVSALLISIPTAASAHTWWGWGGRGHHAPPTAPVSPTPTDEASPSDEPTPADEPTDEPTDESTPTGAPITEAPEPTESAEPDAPTEDADPSVLAPVASFVEDFDVPALAGTLSALYKQAWQPYPDGTSGIYVPSKTVSVHDGVMDVALGGAGAAGTFGSATGAYDHVGGSFSVRAKATGGDGNGAAFMLWPSSDKWSDGEIDFPEGNFESRPSAFQHSMTPGQEEERVQLDSGVSWRDWHTYTIDWDPGQSVTYKVDGKVIGTVTHDVPTTEHRFMFQTGNWGASGNLLIDWVSTTE